MPTFFQAESGPPPYSQAEAYGSELARLRCQPAPAREPDGVLLRRGHRGLARSAAHDPGRAALVLASGDPDGVNPAGRIPPGPAPDGGVDRLRPSPARAGSGGARSHHPVPPGRDAGGATATAA